MPNLGSNGTLILSSTTASNLLNQLSSYLLNAQYESVSNKIIFLIIQVMMVKFIMFLLMMWLMVVQNKKLYSPFDVNYLSDNNNYSRSSISVYWRNPTTLLVNTTSSGTNAISFVYFNIQQTGSNMYTGGTLLSNVTPAGDC